MKKCSMFSLPVSICAWVLVIVVLSHNASATNSDRTYFTNPPSSQADADGMPDYELGNVQEISWTTDLDIFNISIWQRDRGSGNKSNGGNIFAKTNPSETINTFSWAVQTYSLDLSDSSIFFLAIEADSHSWTSANFNITSSSTKSSPSSSSSPISDSDSDSESDPDSPTTTDSPTSLTSTGKIALGLGAGIGAPLISLLAILAYFQYRSARRAYMHTQALQNHPGHHHHHHSHSQQPPPPAWRHPSASPGMDQLTVPPSILPPKQVPMSVPLYRNRSLPPSELPQKLARPVYEPPWEVHSDSAVGLAPGPAPAPVGLGVGVGNWSGDEYTTNTTRTGYGMDSRQGTRNTSVRSSAGLGIPELPGEGSNFI